jgi:hypothetical protein
VPPPNGLLASLFVQGDGVRNALSLIGAIVVSLIWAATALHVFFAMRRERRARQARIPTENEADATSDIDWAAARRQLEGRSR